MLAEEKHALIGEKPFCRFHKLGIIERVCTSSSCNFRVLCDRCVQDHYKMYPYHETQLVDINNWYKEYKKITQQFNPRSNYQAIYHLEEIGSFLKREKKFLEHAGEAMDEAFREAVELLFEKVRCIKEKMNDYLWKDYLLVYEKYNHWIKVFGEYPEKDYHHQLYEELKKELKEYHDRKNLKDFFDKAYTGFFEEKVSSKLLDLNEMISSLRKERNKIEEGFPRFNREGFLSHWEDELAKIETSFTTCLDTTIFQSSKNLEIHNKLPTVQRANSFQPEDQSKLSCIVDMHGCSSLHIRKFSEEAYITVSENKQVHMFNQLQNFRLTKKVQAGSPDPVMSVEILKYERRNLPDVNLLLLGGGDDAPHLELFDLIRDKSLFIYENAHAYGLADLLILKKESEGLRQIFWVASGSADGDIKIWNISVKLLDTAFDFVAECTLKLKVIAHEDIISAMVLVPKCPNHEKSSMITASIDKSLNIWEWEEELSDPDFKFDGETTVIDKLNAKYMTRLYDVHNSRINSVVLIADKADYSDLTYFATGAGDGMISIWNNASKEIVKSFSNQKRAVFSMEYVKNNRLACSANDRDLKQFYIFIWDWTTEKMICYIKDHNARIQRIMSLENNIFASCDKSEVIKIWHLE